MSQQFQTPIPTLPSPIQTLLHPAPTLIADSLPDYLTNSMIHTLRESCIFAMNRRRELELELERAGLTGVGKGKGKDLAEGEKERELEEALKERLGRIGRIVGAQLAELWVSSSCYNVTRYSAELERNRMTSGFPCIDHHYQTT
jgi:hypothetical protein